MNKICNDCNMSLSQALDIIKESKGDKFRIETVNLAELQRLTGYSRKVLRRLKKNGFVELPHGSKGKSRKNSYIRFHWFSGFAATKWSNQLLRNI